MLWYRTTLQITPLWQVITSLLLYSLWIIRDVDPPECHRSLCPQRSRRIKSVAYTPKCSFFLSLSPMRDKGKGFYLLFQYTELLMNYETMRAVRLKK